MRSLNLLAGSALALALAGFAPGTVSPAEALPASGAIGLDRSAVSPGATEVTYGYRRYGYGGYGYRGHGYGRHYGYRPYRNYNYYGYSPNRHYGHRRSYRSW